MKKSVIHATKRFSVEVSILLISENFTRSKNLEVTLFEALINTLNDSKITSGVIGKRLVEAEKTEATISATREKYRPVANRGSILYFVVASLANVDPMYQFSLRYFTDIFNLTIEQAPAQEVLEMRLDQLMEVCSMAIYKNVSRGLFESHKLMFRSEFLIIMFLQCPSLIKKILLLNPFSVS